MSRLKVFFAAGALLLLGIGISVIPRPVQADDLSERQAGLATKIQESIRQKAAIDAELNDVRGKMSQGQVELDTMQTLEQTIMKTLEYIELERTKDELELQQITRLMVETKQQSSLPVLGDGSFTWPVDGFYTIDQAYRSGHKGVDIATRGNHPNVLSVQDGVVIMAGNDGDGFGNKVIVDLGGGRQVLYGHLQSINVELGAYVREGAVIGVVGHTGNSSGDHLHFQMTETGQIEKETVNPAPYLKP